MKLKEQDENTPGVTNFNSLERPARDDSVFVTEHKFSFSLGITNHIAKLMFEHKNNPTNEHESLLLCSTLLLLLCLLQNSTYFK